MEMYLNVKYLLVLFTVSFCRKVAFSLNDRSGNVLHVLPGVQNSRKSPQNIWIQFISF